MSKYKILLRSELIKHPNKMHNSEIKSIPLIVIMGLPYSGKSRLVSTWLEQQDKLNITTLDKVTTRLPRNEENNSPPYSFVSEQQFSSYQSLQEFLWIETNFNCKYGYLKTDFENQLVKNNILLLITNLKDGYKFLKGSFNNVLYFFVLPTSLKNCMGKKSEMIVADLQQRRVDKQTRRLSEISNYCKTELEILKTLDDVHVLVNEYGEQNFNDCLNKLNQKIMASIYTLRQSV